MFIDFVVVHVYFDETRLKSSPAINQSIIHYISITSVNGPISRLDWCVCVCVFVCVCHPLGKGSSSADFHYRFLPQRKVPPAGGQGLQRRTLSNEATSLEGKRMETSIRVPATETFSQAVPLTI